MNNDNNNNNNNLLLHLLFTRYNSNFSLISILREEKLTNQNYLELIHNLRIALRYEGKEYFISENLPYVDEESSKEDIVAYNKHDDESTKVACIMLETMSLEL